MCKVHWLDAADGDVLAWTNYPSINFMASIAAGAPFGFGMVLVFLGIMNYLIDAYTARTLSQTILKKTFANFA